jgi:hypothetical protein
METLKRKRTRTSSNRRTVSSNPLIVALQLLVITTPAAAQKQPTEEHNTDLSAKLPTLIESTRLSDTYWLEAKVKNIGPWRDGWTISTYPADFFIYKIITGTTFETLKTTCKNKNSTIWDLEASQLNQMTETWNNKPYFISTIKQRKAVPEKFTDNKRDCTTVRKNEYRSIIIQKVWDTELCEAGITDGICIKVMDLGIAQYTKLPTYTSDKRWVYNLMETRTDAQQLTRLADMIKAHRPKTTPGMAEAILNIKLNIDIINSHIGPNGIIPTDFTTVKNAILNNERQIRSLFTQVATATLLKPASQKIFVSLKSWEHQ